MSGAGWHAIVLAAGRGPLDPMAKAYGVANKCAIAVGGEPMLARVGAALRESGVAETLTIVIEDGALAAGLLAGPFTILAPAASAPASVLAALERGVAFPVLVTTGDHALLTPAMVRHFCRHAEHSGADFCVGLATAETVLAAYPQTRRTFFKLGRERVSGCNLFALRSDRARALLARWQYLEAARKKPWRLVAAFGPTAFLRFATGTLDLRTALRLVSRRLGLTVDAVLMPFAEAAIDIDKPADKELAEAILAKRG